MSTLGAAMAALSQESAINKVFTDANGMDDVVEELIQDEVEINATSKNIEEANERMQEVTGAAVSLEAAVKHVTWLQDNGFGLSGEAFVQWQDTVRLSMESKNIPEQLYLQDMDDIQTSFESDQDEEYSTEALKSMGATLKRLWEAFLAALKKAGEWMKKHWNQLFGAGEKLIKASAALDKKLATIKYEKKDATIPKNNQYAYLLTADGKFKTVPQGTMTAYTHFAAMERLAKATFQDLSTGSSVWTHQDKEAVNMTHPTRKVRCKFIGDSSKISVESSNSVQISEEKSFMEATKLLPETFPAMSLREIKGTAQVLHNAGRALQKLRDLEREWKRAEQKVNKINTDTENAEIVRKNAILSLAIKLAMLDSEYYVATCKAEYHYAVASLKAHADAEAFSEGDKVDNSRGDKSEGEEKRSEDTASKVADDLSDPKDDQKTAVVKDAASLVSKLPPKDKPEPVGSIAPDHMILINKLTASMNQGLQAAMGVQDEINGYMEFPTLDKDGRIDRTYNYKRGLGSWSRKYLDEQIDIVRSGKDKSEERFFHLTDVVKRIAELDNLSDEEVTNKMMQVSDEYLEERGLKRSNS